MFENNQRQRSADNELPEIIHINGEKWELGRFNGQPMYLRSNKQDITREQIDIAVKKLDQLYNQLPQSSRHSGWEDFDPTSVTKPYDLKNMNFKFIKGDPHLGSATLSRDDLIEVIAWAYEVSNMEKPDEINLANLMGSYPKSLSEQAAASAAEALYGKNNYIGPGKTGMDGPLIEVVGTFPALSKADAEARAHDIGLFFSESPKIDEVLPTAARYAQFLRPGFSRSNPIIANGYMNRNNIIRSGNVEKNPGPRYTYEGNKAVDDCIIISSNPAAEASHLNANVTDAYVDEMEYDNKRGSWTVRNGADTITDTIRFDDAVQMLTTTDLTPWAGGQTFCRKAFRISYLNNHYKSELPVGALGNGLNSSMQDFNAYMAAQRTHTNTFSGDQQLGSFTRSSNLDYGMYVDMAKYLSYCNAWMLLSGDDMNSWTPDIMARKPGLVAQPLPVSLFPMSSNYSYATAPANTIICWYMGFDRYVDCLRGIIPFPGDTNPNIMGSAAFRAINAGTNGELAAAIAILACEYPLFGGVYPTETVIGRAPGFAPSIVASAHEIVSEHTRIDGPRVIVFVGTDNALDMRIGDVVTGLTIPEYDWIGGVIAPTGIFGVLKSYLQANWFVNVSGPYDHQNIMTHLLSYMDIFDWRAAIDLAGHICFWKQPYMTYMITAGARAVTPAIITDQVLNGFTLDASFNITDIASPVVQADAVEIRASPVYNSSGFFSYETTLQPFDGTGNAQLPIDTNMYVCDSNFSTYLGVALNFYKKNTLTNNKVSNMSRGVFNRIWYAMRDIHNIRIQCAHEYYSQFGTIHGYLHNDRANKQIEVRSMLLDSLANKNCDWQEKYAGWCYLMYQRPYGRGKTRPPIANTVFNTGSWWASPLVLYNDLLNSGEKDWRISEGKWTFDCNMVYANIDPNVKMENTSWSPAGGLIYGVNLTIPTAQRVMEEYLYTITKDKDDNGVEMINKVLNSYAKQLWCMVSANDTINLNCVFRYLDACTVLQQTSGYGLIRPVIGMTKQWMKWTSASAPSNSLRDASRPGRSLFLPFFPPQFSDINGMNYVISFASSGTFYNLNLKFNLNGQGSMNVYRTVGALPGNLRLLGSSNSRPFEYKSTRLANVTNPVQKNE